MVGNGGLVNGNGLGRVRSICLTRHRHRRNTLQSGVGIVSKSGGDFCLDNGRYMILSDILDITLLH